MINSRRIFQIIQKRFTIISPKLRNYSTDYPYGDFYHSKLEIHPSKNLKQKPPHDSLRFGTQFTDHMLLCEWTRKDGWKAPKIVPYQNLSLDPAASVLHYAIETFEGMKAYSSLNDHNEKYLFRPEMNAKRMNASNKRLALPEIKEEEFIKCLAELVNLDKSWIPAKKGYSLYLRPTCIATDPRLGVSKSDSALFYIIASPVGPYFQRGFVPVRLLADPQYIRAAKGGTGKYKLGANYAGTILPQMEAQEKGYDQLLWLSGENHDEVSEVGTMNMMFYWYNKEGQKEIITAPLEDGTVLPGVTRDSILQIAKEWNIKTVERTFKITEVIEAIKEGRVIEAFGTGTACIVCPVKTISYLGVDYDMPLPEDSIAKKFADKILSIQHGEVPSEWSVSINKLIGKQ